MAITLLAKNGHFWSIFPYFRTKNGHFLAILARFGPFWGHFGPIWAILLGISGKMRHLGASDPQNPQNGHFGPPEGPIWGPFFRAKSLKLPYLLAFFGVQKGSFLGSFWPIFGPFFAKIPGGGPGNRKNGIFECGVYIGPKWPFFPKVYKIPPLFGVSGGILVKKPRFWGFCPPKPWFFPYFQSNWPPKPWFLGAFLGSWCASGL